MKTALLLTLILLCSCKIQLAEDENEEENPVIIPDEITLTHRIKNHCNNDLCRFDLYNMTQEYGYGLSIEFGNDHGENSLDTTLVVDEFGLIVDLGESSCSKVEKNNPYSRRDEPRDWLNYSHAWDKLNTEGRSSINIVNGHCYLMYKSSSNHRIIIMFHVSSMIKDKSITLDEIELFERTAF